MQRKNICICLTLIFYCLSVNGRQHLSFKHLGVEDGLSNNYIVSIAQDRQGCIWIATESGLNRFDGQNFTVYTTKNSNLVSNELNTLLFDENDNMLWIGTQRDGLSLFNCTTQTFTNFTNDDGLVTNDVTHLTHAADGGIWITHYHTGVEHYNKTTGEFTLWGKDTHANNWCALDDGKGNLYIGHVSTGLSIINLKDKTTRNFSPQPGNPTSIPGNSVRTIHMDQFNNIWLGTNQGLALYHPQTETFTTFKHHPQNPNSLGSNSIFAIEEMKDGTLWIGTDMAGLSILNLNDLTLRHPNEIEFKNILATSRQNTLSSPNIKYIFQDSFDNIWIGDRQKGIDFISKTQPVFQILPYLSQRGEIKQIWSLYMDKNEQIWIGGNSELTAFVNGQWEKTIDLSANLSPLYRFVNKIYSDSKGDLWLSVYRNGAVKWNAKTNKIERLPTDILNTMSIRSFYEDSNGKMWISTEAGIFSYDDNRQYRYEEKINNALEDKVVHDIICDTQSKMWIGTFGKGLHIFDKDENLIAKLTTDNGFCSNAINDLFVDSKGSIWVATRKGLVYIENSNSPFEYTLYGDNYGIENIHIQSILEDMNGHIWVSTNAGISLLNKERNRFDNFNYRDGVPIGDFINNSACATSDGTLYFASLNGVCYFNPKNLEQKAPATPVQIISCHSFNKKIENQPGEIIIPSADGKINLPYDRNSFRITFSIPDFSQSGQTEYAYQMEGVEDIWYQEQGNQVIFRNIPPGRYTFKVKARLKNQEWDEKTVATLPIYIRPPLWLTWYAKLLYLLIICTIGYMIIRAYKNRLKLETSLELERKESRNKQELNDERLRFYTNITHELRTPLTLIIGPLEDVLYDVSLPRFFQKKIELIHNSTLRLLNLINQILEFRTTETQNRKLTVSKADLASLVTEIGLRYKELNQNEDVTIQVEIDTAATVLYFDADMVNTILNNLLSNALKYTPAGQIKLILRSVVVDNKGYTEIEVADTGYGIAPEALPHIFDRYYQAKGKYQASGTGIGLALVKSLAELHQGELTVESAVGRGTRFIWRLLTGNSYPTALHIEADHAQLHSEAPATEEVADMQDSLSLVLVIEDNADIRDYIASSLSGDYQVITAVNGQEGLEMARQQIPNIIVSDIMMPEMDGLEFCSQVKKDIRTSHIPVILLTAKDSIRNREEGYESGADSYLTKPFSAKLLRSRIHNLLESRRKLASQVSNQTSQQPGSEGKEPLPEQQMGKLDREFLTRLTQLILNNLMYEKLDVVFLREKMNMTGSTFYRKLKALTGLSPMEFIRKIKIGKAAELLASGKHNISEVTYLTGFNDASYFRASFKKEYGITPTEYLKGLNNT